MATAMFAPVAPIQVLHAMYSHGPSTFGDYHLLLAHHIMEFPEEFRLLMRRIDNDRCIKPRFIVDNSLVELKGAVDLDMMASAVEIIRECDQAETVVAVLPDVMGDGAATREVIEQHYDAWAKRLIPLDVEMMGVAQGSNWEDYLATLDYINQLPDSSWVGVPRVLVKTLGSRLGAARKAVNSGLAVHLLGFSDEQADDLQCARLPGIEGIDSAVPLRLPFDWSVQLGLESIPPRPDNWFETAAFDAQMLRNLQHARMVFEAP